MKFRLDEGLPYRLAAYLKNDGHDVATCGQDLPFALSDRVILASAYRSHRILLVDFITRNVHEPDERREE